MSKDAKTPAPQKRGPQIVKIPGHVPRVKVTKEKPAPVAKPTPPAN